MIKIGEHFLNNAIFFIESLSKNLEHEMLICIYAAVVSAFLVITFFIIREKRGVKHDSKRFKKRR